MWIDIKFDSLQELDKMVRTETPVESVVNSFRFTERLKNYHSGLDHDITVKNADKYSACSDTSQRKAVANAIKTLHDYDDIYHSKKFQHELSERRKTAEAMFGTPNTNSVLAYYYQEQKTFNALLPKISSADYSDFISYYQEVEYKAPKLFQYTLGINTSKYCHIFCHSHELYKALVKGKSTKNAKIVNRSRLAISLVSPSASEQTKNRIQQYKSAVKAFHAAATKRYHITDWNHAPSSDSAMDDLWLLRDWSISKYQQMQKRLSVLEKASNPRAAEDWDTLKQSVKSHGYRIRK